MILDEPVEGIQLLFFERDREAGDQILNIEGLSASTDGEVLFKKIDLNLAKGDKVVVFF